MNRLAAILCALVLLSPISSSQDAVATEFFHAALDPYGEWILTGQYGYCWHPTQVADRLLDRRFL